MSDNGHDRDLLELGDRLARSRPVPAAQFRGDLRRTLVGHRPPPALRRRIAVCLVSGAALLGVAALGVAGAGPLAPQPPPGVQQASVSR